MRKVLAVLLVLAMVICFAGCGENGDTTATTNTTIDSETATTTTLADVETEDTTTTEAADTTAAVTQSTKADTNGTSCAHASVKKATCIDPEVCEACGATISAAKGHAFYKGKCLRCDAADPSYSAGPAVTKITLNKTEAKLLSGETLDLKATIAPANAADKTVTWSSSATSVATVDANGSVTAVGEGEATITASSANGVKATCKITVADLIVNCELPTVVRYKADYGKVGIEYQIIDVKYTYDKASRKLTLTINGNIAYAGNGSPEPTTPSFIWKLFADYGSTVAEETWVADRAESVGGSYTTVVTVENVEPIRYTLSFFSTYTK